MDFAVGNGNLEMVSFMHSVDPLNCVPFTMIDVAVDRGFTDIVKFILDTFPRVNTDKFNLYDRAATKGNLETIKLLCERQPNARNYSFLMAKAAALNGHVEILEWLWETYQEAGSIEWIVPVALKNKSEVLSWLVERHFQSDSSRDVETNIQKPIFTANIQVVQLIHVLGLPLHNIYPLSLAVAQFLHSHGVQFTQKHVQLAILHTTANRSGLLDVVKYIHENCPEVQFQQSDMDDAAAVGDLEMVRFLHEHRKEGCTTAAMNSAVYYGHIEYLMESYKDKDWDSLFDEHGRLPANSMSLMIFNYLIDNYSGFEDGRMLFHAIVYGEVKLLDHINQRGKLTACDIEAALENAQRHYKPEMVKYLTALLDEKAIKSKQTDKINHQDS
ncbi:hypothetical protein Ae201684P_006749 [Aphanomyces euteiches]|nr:hypothetical protein Ae201684P_006749 [Aphanomyces euteiches]